MKPDRLLSLDILRGITIAGMILVNNPGNENTIYAPLRHAVWNGLTPTDLIFPFFMFIMGISTFISLRKSKFEYCTPLLKKIIKRTCVIFLIGLGLSWISVSFGTFHNLAPENLPLLDRLAQSVTNFGHLRILGVMQRLALAYGLTALIAITVKHKYIPYIIAGTLIGYFLILLFGNGYQYDDSNILSIIDQKILGINHMFNDRGLDPEGILSTIPSVCHVLIGFCCGHMLIDKKDNNQRMLSLFLVGVSLFFIGFLLDYACPVNKKIWSPSFVTITCGMGAMFLALLTWIIDVKGYKKWCVPFEAFGVNPLFIYVLAGVLATTLEGIRITVNENVMSLRKAFYDFAINPVFGDYFGSFIYALLFVTITWGVGYILYKKHIYIKI